MHHLSVTRQGAAMIKLPPECTKESVAGLATKHIPTISATPAANATQENRRTVN